MKRFRNFLNENNEFNDDTERLTELKKCLEEALFIMNNENDLDTAYNKSRTLIRDVLARYNQNKKFITADATYDDDLEFLDD